MERYGISDLVWELLDMLRPSICTRFKAPATDALHGTSTRVRYYLRWAYGSRPMARVRIHVIRTRHDLLTDRSKTGRIRIWLAGLRSSQFSSIIDLDEEETSGLPRSRTSPASATCCSSHAPHATSLLSSPHLLFLSVPKRGERRRETTSRPSHFFLFGVSVRLSPFISYTKRSPWRSPHLPLCPAGVPSPPLPLPRIGGLLIRWRLGWCPFPPICPRWPEGLGAGPCPETWRRFRQRRMEKRRRRSPLRLFTRPLHLTGNLGLPIAGNPIRLPKFGN